jgi:hypothetical protein
MLALFITYHVTTTLTGYPRSSARTLGQASQSQKEPSWPQAANTGLFARVTHPYKSYKCR